RARRTVRLRDRVRRARRAAQRQDRAHRSGRGRHRLGSSGGRAGRDGRPVAAGTRRGGDDRQRQGRVSISAHFVQRPVMTILVMIGILIFGIVGYRLLPVNALPNVDFPTIQVQAQLPGASPDTMASAVATPLEKQFSTIAGVDSMTSTSSNGLT